MNTLFGQRDDFAIEAGVDDGSSLSLTIWGHMCVWCRGTPLGDLDDPFCAIGIARDRFQTLLNPVHGRLRIDCLWADTLAGLDGVAAFNFFDRLLYGWDDDGEQPHRRIEAELPRDVDTWSDFNFLTNWGEQFDGYKSFILRPPGDSVRILSRRLPAVWGRAVDVSRDMFVSAVGGFCDWFDEIQRQRTLEYEAAIAEPDPPREGTPWFPDEALAHLRSARFQAAAFPCLEVPSESLFWSDEAYLEFAAVCASLGSPWFRAPIRFRSSLIRGQPDEASRAAWDELRRLCPQWPGFRSERCSAALRDELDRQIAGPGAS